MRSFDWASTPFGPLESWSFSLRTMVSIMLANGFPMLLWWGPDYLSIYNDAYIPVLGAKHPWALGRPVREVWSEIYDVLKPLIDAPYNGGPPTSIDDIRLDIRRHGFLEETHFTIAYSAVPDPNNPGGVLATVHEITGKVLAERRARALRDLGLRSTEGRTAEAACQIAARALSAYRDDVPFALLYVVDADGAQARLAGATEGADGPEAVALDSASPWPLAELVRSMNSTAFDDPERGKALLVPIRSTKAAKLAGFMVAGVSPVARLDELYHGFFELMAAQIATAIANVRAYEEERRKAEALAEIDRAKTAFFSNVSHEFRTPLTLMLGPLEDALQSGGLSAPDRERLELARRNSQRLLKLVNSLLDFSRMEAGRAQASYRPTNLAALTAELASVFRSTIEAAGLKFGVHCTPLSEPIYVDREMWEKIVLNLLSNAFKFTFEGEIDVSLATQGSSVRLSVRDTGSGIPAAEISRLFERFHRVSGVKGRSYEGSGIGLALVQELARLHGGRVSVDSVPGEGSRFHVEIPRGKAHLPAEHIVENAAATPAGTPTELYLAEMAQWQPGLDAALDAADGINAANLPLSIAGGRILLADDNADMRGYVKRLLEHSGYEVDAVADGAEALQAARARKPDLVLTDVMMPRLDGFGLLEVFRGDPELQGVPVVLLSARAGQEARIEGMRAGADDYLVKPFGASELLARVDGLLGLSRARREAETAVRRSEERLRALVNASTNVVYRMNADWSEMLELEGQGFIADTDSPRSNWLEDYIHPDDRDTVLVAIRNAIETRSTFELEHRVVKEDGTLGWTSSRAVPLFGPSGEIVEWFGAASDISSRVEGETTRKLLLRELDHRVKNTLATVQAVAHQTLRYTSEPGEFAERFSHRVQAMARVHALLTEESWRSAGLHQLLNDQLTHGMAERAKLNVSGPEVRLEPQMALHLGLMLHELGTNSLKYGAFSSPGGTVSIGWEVRKGQLVLHWTEHGGPPVSAPRSQGFGTTLIERSCKGLGGDAHVTFAAEGVSWEIVLPLPSAVGAQTAGDTQRRQMSDRTERATPTAARPLAGQRVLAMEDEPLVSLMMVAMLQDAGAEVVSASAEEEALSALQAMRFDRAVLDVNLHGQAVRAVPAALAREGIPFLFVTGYGRAGLPPGYEQAPALSKPFDNRRLVEAVVALDRPAEGVVRLRS